MAAISAIGQAKPMAQQTALIKMMWPMSSAPRMTR